MAVVSASAGSHACPATENTATASSSRISSSADPPSTWRDTDSGDTASISTTLAAIVTPRRQATWASTSLPRGVPAAVTTVASPAAATTAAAHAAAA